METANQCLYRRLATKHRQFRTPTDNATHRLNGILSRAPFASLIFAFAPAFNIFITKRQYSHSNGKKYILQTETLKYFYIKIKDH